MSNYLDTHGLATLWGDIVDTFARKVAATQSENGLMSATDKSKLDGIANNANNYELPEMSPTTRGGAKLGSGLSMDGDVLSVALESESNGTGAGPIVELTAKGHAEQDGTPSPDSPVEIQVARGRNLSSVSTLVSDANGGIGAGTTYRYGTVTSGVTYTLSFDVLIAASGKVIEHFIDSGSTLQGSNISLATTGRKTMTFTATDSGELRPYMAGGTYEANVRCIANIQLERGSTPTPYVPYGHVGLEAQGKNLFGRLVYPNPAGCTVTLDGDEYVITANRADIYLGAYRSTAGDSYSAAYGPLIPVEPSTQYVTSVTNDQFRVQYASFYDSSLTVISGQSVNRDTRAFTTPPDTAYVLIRFGNSSATTGTTYRVKVQLELGSTATEYEPYYHSTTPIPLPSRGWVGALPDGTADTLTLDGAGKVVWTESVGRYDVIGTEGQGQGVGTQGGGFYRSAVRVLNANPSVSPTSNGDGYCSHAAFFNSSTDASYHAWTSGEYLVLVSDDDTAPAIWQKYADATVLYPLATPVTEDMGYVDLPDIPEGATLSVPELDALNVRYVVDDAAVTLARQYYDRARSEYEGRIESLEAAVAEIIAG